MIQRSALHLTLIALALVAVACMGRIGGSSSVRHFTAAALAQEPAQPAGEITRGEADGIETAGGAYFVATFHDDGSLATLERRSRGATEYKIEYTYSGGRVVTKKTTAADGSVNEETL